MLRKAQKKQSEERKEDSINDQFTHNGMNLKLTTVKRKERKNKKRR